MYEVRHCNNTLSSQTFRFMILKDEVTGCGFDDSVSIFVGPQTFSSPPCADFVCGPPSLLSSWYRGLFHREERLVYGTDLAQGSC
jgi:hypothetical protein